MIAVKDINRYELHFRQFMLVGNTVTTVIIDVTVKIIAGNIACVVSEGTYYKLFLNRNAQPV